MSINWSSLLILSQRSIIFHSSLRHHWITPNCFCYSIWNIIHTENNLQLMLLLSGLLLGRVLSLPCWEVELLAFNNQWIIINVLSLNISHSSLQLLVLTRRLFASEYRSRGVRWLFFCVFSETQNIRENTLKKIFF